VVPDVITNPVLNTAANAVLEVAAAFNVTIRRFSSACVSPRYGSAPRFVKICQWSRVLVMVGDIRFG
jgi:hypothetical protein